jgi:co-chaperonin GroES (HSP10)
MTLKHANDGRSASLNQASNTDVPGDYKIRPLRDQIIVEPLNVVLSHTIIVKENTKPLRGIVKAVGPGHYPMRYNADKGPERTKMWKSEVFQPTEVKVGDVIELGGYDFRGYTFPSIYWGGKLHIICREADVSGILDGVTADQAKAEAEYATV